MRRHVVMRSAVAFLASKQRRPHINQIAHVVLCTAELTPVLCRFHVGGARFQGRPCRGSAPTRWPTTRLSLGTQETSPSFTARWYAGKGSRRSSFVIRQKRSASFR